MDNKVNRKRKADENYMSTEQKQLEKIIDTLKKKYGFSEDQIKVEYLQKNSRIDIAIFSKNSEDPIIIGEIKVGNFVMPFAEYQIKKYMKICNADYGFLTNGKEWIFWESTDGEINQTSNMPKSKDITDNNDKKIMKKSIKQSGYNAWILQDIFRSSGNFYSNDAFLQLIFFKIYDEKYEKNNNFREIIDNPKSYEEVFEKLWNKTNKKFPNLFSENFLNKIEISAFGLSNLISFSNFLISKLGIEDFAKMILLRTSMPKSRIGDNEFISKDLVDLFFKLAKISPDDKIIIPHSPTGLVLGILQKLHENFNTIEGRNIVVLEIYKYRIQILKIFSEFLNLESNITLFESETIQFNNDFPDFNQVIAIPPFEKLINNRDRISENADDYGNESIAYFINEILLNFRSGTTVSLIVPLGFLFRENQGLNKIRNEILQKCKIKGIIQLPPNAFPYTSIQSALLIFEIGNNDDSDYEIFMSVIPKNESANQREMQIDEKIKNTVADNYYLFSKKELPIEQNQNSFTVLKSEIIKNGWTVTDKIPEIKIVLNIPDKNRQILENIVEIIQGVHFSSRIISEGEEFSLLRISDIKDSTINYTNIKKIKIPKKDIPRYEKYLLRKGDIIISKTGTIGKTAIITENIHYCLASSQLIILRPNQNEIFSEFLFNSLNSSLVKQQINAIVSGYIPSISISKFKKIILSVPPLNEQKQKISKTTDILKEISKHEEILKQLRHELQETRDNDG